MHSSAPPSGTSLMPKLLFIRLTAALIALGSQPCAQALAASSPLRVDPTTGAIINPPPASQAPPDLSRVERARSVVLHVVPLTASFEGGAPPQDAIDTAICTYATHDMVAIAALVGVIRGQTRVAPGSPDLASRLEIQFFDEKGDQLGVFYWNHLTRSGEVDGSFSNASKAGTTDRLSSTPLYVNPGTAERLAIWRKLPGVKLEPGRAAASAAERKKELASCAQRDAL